MEFTRRTDVLAHLSAGAVTEYADWRQKQYPSLLGLSQFLARSFDLCTPVYTCSGTCVLAALLREYADIPSDGTTAGRKVWKQASASTDCDHSFCNRPDPYSSVSEYCLIRRQRHRLCLYSPGINYRIQKKR